MASRGVAIPIRSADRPVSGILFEVTVTDAAITAGSTRAGKVEPAATVGIAS